MIKSPNKTAALIIALLVCVSVILPTFPIIMATDARTLPHEDAPLKKTVKSVPEKIVYDTSANGFTYTILNETNKTCVITDYTGSETDIVIPRQIAGYTVVNIGSTAFSNCQRLTSVIIPDSVTKIGDNAFRNCTSLTLVTIPDSVTSIEFDTFWNCTSLIAINVDANNSYYSSDDGILFNKSKTQLIQYPAQRDATTYTIPNSVTDICYAFYKCEKLTSVIIPDGVTSLDYMTFFNCSGLTSIIIPDSVTKIGAEVFFGCTGLTSVTIGNSVESIISYAFSYCTSLTSITLPDSITNIDYNTFEGCTSMTAINVDENNTAYSSIDGVLFNKDKTELIQYPKGKSGSYTIPDSVTIIGLEVFSGCASLTGVTIPDSVTEIRKSAFSGCSGLTSITIPDSVTNIRAGAFSNCSSLTAINVDENNTAYSSIDGVLFCKSKTELMQYPTDKSGSYTIPDGITSIGVRAFAECLGLTSVAIENSVTDIGREAFCSCTNLTSFIMGNSVIRIEEHAFDGCSSLTSITMPDSLKSIGDRVFANCSSLTSVTIASKIEMYAYAFEDCTSLTSATFNAEPPHIMQENVFFNCADDFCIYYTSEHASSWAPNGETTWKGYPIKLLNTVTGDVNGDGDTNSRDIAALQRHILGSAALTGGSLVAADLNGDGSVNSRDIAALQRKILND